MSLRENVFSFFHNFFTTDSGPCDILASKSRCEHTQKSDRAFTSTRELRRPHFAPRSASRRHRAPAPRLDVRGDRSGSDPAPRAFLILPSLVTHRQDLRALAYRCHDHHVGSIWRVVRDTTSEE